MFATMAAVGELVVMQSAGEFGFFEVRGDFLVRYSLEAHLEKVDFLWGFVILCS